MGTVSRYSSGYDFLGNVTASREQHGSDYKSSTFTYDSRGRLLSETTGVNGAVSATMAYAYDPLGRPKTTTSGTGSTAGNITTLTRYSSSGSATTLSYTYTGNRRSTFAYDVNGNVTNDATNSLQTSYNLLNFPAQTKSGSTVKANYKYLSDGTKASVLNASGAGYDYNGTFTYSHASGGTRTLESVAFGGGRIRKTGSSYAVDYYVTDHLGSVRAIVNASGTIVEQNDFYPFGTRQQNGLTTLSANRWRFSGKEGYDGAFGIALDDFGARRYDRTAWTSIDPLAEKYYSLSPYAYCAGNPVNIRDAEGNFPLLSNIVGAAVAAGVEYGIQVANNFLTGSNYKEAFKDVDAFDIAVAAGEGFISSGTSIVKNHLAKQAINVGAEILGNTIDLNLTKGSDALDFNSMSQIVVQSGLGLMFGMIENSSFLPSFKKKSITKQMDAARGKFHAQGRGVSAQEAKKMHLKAKEKKQFIDTINQMLTEEQKELFGSWIDDLFGQLFDDDEE